VVFGLAVAGLALILYLSGEPSSSRAVGAQAATLRLAGVVGGPLSLVLAPVLPLLAGRVAWAVITAIPVVNGIVIGVLADLVVSAARVLRRG